MTLGIAIAGFVATVVAAFGGAWYGGRLQRSSDRETLTLQLRVDFAAKFLGSTGDFISVYAVAWAPGTENLTMEERQAPIFNMVMRLRAESAAVAIVGPPELADIAQEILKLAGVRGLSTSPDADLARDLGRSSDKFKTQAQQLPPSGQKNGRKWLPWWSTKKPNQKELPGQ
jgi:hypothetical protein